MKHFLKHKGYYGEVYYSEEDECYVGIVLGIIGLIGVHEDTFSETHKELIEAIDEYLESCKEDGRMPIGTDPVIAREIESYLSIQLEDNLEVVENIENLAFAR